MDEIVINCSRVIEAVRAGEQPADDRYRYCMSYIGKFKMCAGRDLQSPGHISVSTGGDKN